MYHLFHIPYHQSYVDLYHIINEASQKTYAFPSCIHHHTTRISLNHVKETQDVRYSFQCCTIHKSDPHLANHIPYPSTRPAISRMPQVFTTQYAKVTIKENI
jgi:hypothetical protein